MPYCKSFTKDTEENEKIGGLSVNISELLARNGRKYPEQTAVIEEHQQLTYAQLDTQVNQLAHSLKNHGINEGDKVLLFMPNTSNFLLTYFAVLRLGGIIVPVSARLTPTELEYIINHSEAKALVTEHILYNSCAPIQDKFRLLWVKTGPEVDGWYSFENLLASGEKEPIVCQLKEDDIATMLYTSGTTGNPKGVLFSYRNILTVATMICIEMEMKKESRILHMMPLSHSAPLHLFLISGTYVGATHLLTPAFTPELLLNVVESWKPTHFFGAPVAYLLTAKNPYIEKRDLSSMTHWVYGGAPLDQKEVQFLRQAFKTDQLYCVYGLTEAGPNGTLLRPEEHRGKEGSIGQRAALNCELKLVNDDGDEVGPNKPGEIILSGEGNMIGYYKDDEKTEEALKNGWLYTGDMAKMDDDGFIWVIDRKKDMIISGGINVFPKEVEAVLNQHPSISESAVVGVPHEDWGETVVAYVVVKEVIDDIERDCKQFLSNKLADYKIPRKIEVIDQLPRNPTGKILKHQLKTVIK